MISLDVNEFWGHIKATCPASISSGYIQSIPVASDPEN